MSSSLEEFKRVGNRFRNTPGEWYADESPSQDEMPSLSALPMQFYHHLLP